ncbi:putative ABC transporter ATP-binding protein YheS [BD1-7 clade bacterium]|uniref:Probable ATP-binding protein YheS n=1 Tax=BD1-7 clade bacterium TaxID=2029982 RepID=A0A5S9QFV2_9GAMM|nr:putative ABC transporter ATP-binding protein YheS [BD1-7 clade bacterium]
MEKEYYGAMISLKQISLQRSGKTLFEKASLTLYHGQRFALIGANGCGKSSLFQVILGGLQPDAGDIDFGGDLRIAHMAQEVGHSDRSACDYVIDGFAELRKLEGQLAEAEAADNHNAMAKIHAHLDALDAYTIRYRAEMILAGLGFAATDVDRSVTDFSGGWRIRLNLARALLCPSDVLLLDEPTNHLDIEAIHWLEQWISAYHGTVLLISHDRDFIDASVNHIAHVEDHDIKVYSGSYSDFEHQRAEKLAQQQAIHVKQQARAKDLQRFIDRFRAQATKAKQAQSRIKALERMQMVGAVREASPYQFKIPCSDKVGSPLINAFDLDLGYPDKITAKKARFSILPGMRLGLLGVNGSGKSTLIKTLVGDLEPRGGEMTCSDTLRIGYFAQHQLEALDLQASPLLHLQRLDSNARDQELRDFLGSFRIHGDMAVETIGHFSGGEKARLALALVAYQKPNLLLMDEPTNHLDIEMREALADALQRFEGAVILVSHDRYLLRHCVDEYWLLRQQRLTEFNGDLDDYYALQADDAKLAQQAKGEGDDTDQASKENKKQQRQQAAQKRVKLAPITKKIQQLEKAIEKLTSELDDLREQLSDPDIYAEANKARLQPLMDKETSIKQQLDDAETDWFEQQELLHEMEASID